MNIFFAFLAAYLLGTIPTGLWAGLLIKGVDIRKHGSGNIGATNVFRVVGKKWGIVVLLLDALKGYVAVRIGQMIAGDAPLFQNGIFFGIAAILGHSFSVWLSFKGGKGVATSLGVFLAVAPTATLITFGFWILIFSLSRIISVASLAAAAAFPVMVFIIYNGTPLFSQLFPISLGLCAFIVYTHRANIQRLRQNQEKKLF